MCQDYATYLIRKRIEHGEKFNPQDLDPRFVPFFNNGRRVKIEMYGEVITGTIGVTTGWKPCFLLMRTRRSRGSSWTLGPSAKILGFKQDQYYHTYAQPQ